MMTLQTLSPLYLLTLCAGAANIVSDPFTDGSRSNATGGDAAGLVYFLGQSTGALAVADDPGIGAGNALKFTPASSGQKFVANFPPITLLNGGETLQVTFDLRYDAAPTSQSGGLRMGIFDTKQTQTTSDGGGNRTDDEGYVIMTNPASAATATTVAAEASGNDILGGASPSFPANFGSAGTSLNWGVTKHRVTLTLARQASGDLLVSAQLDSGTVASGTVPAAAVLTYRFDEFAIAHAPVAALTQPLWLDNLVITAPEDNYQLLRERWVVSVTGAGTYNTADSFYTSRINSVTNSANTQWNNMDKSPGRIFLWSDLTSTTDSGAIASAFSRLRSMAVAWRTPGSTLYQSAAMAADLAGALDWMYANRYNETKTKYDNWYDWEIGAPLNVVDIAIFMEGAIPASTMDDALNAVDHFTPWPYYTAGTTSGTFTGANLLDKIRIVAVRGSYARDPAKLLAARDALSNVLPYVTSGDGYYTDGSFIQHGRHPYTGSYGSVAIADLSLLLPWLRATAWECVDSQQTNVVRWIYDSYEPLLYKAAMADCLRGRAISRSSSTDRSIGHGILHSILRLVPWAPVADAARMKSLIKANAQADTVRNFSTAAPLALAAAARDLMNDAAVTPRPELVGYFAFPSMDRAMHLRPGFGYAISMSSSRIYNYESINSENLRGWFTGDGMTYLYNSDLNQFADNFWPTVNPFRLPGVTSPNIARADGLKQSSLSTKNWVGGAALDGIYGVIGMELDTQNSTLTGRKSWFLFDDEVVCLGAGITSTDASVPIETTVENRKLSTVGNEAFTVNGTAKPATLGWSESLSGVQWCHLAGTGGYYFPVAANLQALREARTGDWSAIGASAGSFTRNYLTLYFNHAAIPTNASYSHVLLPNFTSAQTAAYAASPEVQIVENTSAAQGVREIGLGLLAVNFWNTATKTVDYLTSNSKASVIARQTPTNLILCASDPTQANTGNLVLTLNKRAWSLVAADPGVTVNQLSPTIQVTIAMASRYGQSARAEFVTASPIEQWRYANFGATANTGTAADTFDANGDGEVNLLEFATNQNALAPALAATTAVKNAGGLDITYTRSIAAMNEGVTFTVEWSDTLSGNSWSSAGVSETVLSNNGIVQQVKATVPAGVTRRFARLRVVKF